MANLNIASKANQAVTLPVLLVSNYANQLDSNTIIKINFEDANILDSSDGACVELITKDDAPTYGLEQVISKLLHAYPFLQETSQNLVS